MLNIGNLNLTGLSFDGYMVVESKADSQPDADNTFWNCRDIRNNSLVVLSAIEIRDRLRAQTSAPTPKSQIPVATFSDKNYAALLTAANNVLDALAKDTPIDFLPIRIGNFILVSQMSNTTFELCYFDTGILLFGMITRQNLLNLCLTYRDTPYERVSSLTCFKFIHGTKSYAVMRIGNHYLSFNTETLMFVSTASSIDLRAANPLDLVSKNELQPGTVCGGYLILDAPTRRNKTATPCLNLATGDTVIIPNTLLKFIKICDAPVDPFINKCIGRYKVSHAKVNDPNNSYTCIDIATDKQLTLSFSELFAIYRNPISRLNFMNMKFNTFEVISCLGYMGNFDVYYAVADREGYIHAVSQTTLYRISQNKERVEPCLWWNRLSVGTLRALQGFINRHPEIPVRPKTLDIAEVTNRKTFDTSKTLEQIIGTVYTKEQCSARALNGFKMSYAPISSQDVSNIADEKPLENSVTSKEQPAPVSKLASKPKSKPAPVKTPYANGTKGDIIGDYFALMPVGKYSDFRTNTVISTVNLLTNTRKILSLGFLRQIISSLHNLEVDLTNYKLGDVRVLEALPESCGSWRNYLVIDNNGERRAVKSAQLLAKATSKKFLDKVRVGARYGNIVVKECLKENPYSDYPQYIVFDAVTSESHILSARVLAHLAFNPHDEAQLWWRCLKEF